jgi:UDP-galactopyranose mutase
LGSTRDLLCLSHLRWNFVFQRPQHLMVRFARTRRVFFVEEPIVDASEPRLDVSLHHGVHVVVPHLPPATGAAAGAAATRALLAELARARSIDAPLAWLYTPLALPLIDGFDVDGIVYDCMDELSGFAGAAADLPVRERELLERADLVFTGGMSLYEAKRALHPRVHAFPSSVDVGHFARARRQRAQPVDQQPIARPRLGYCGVIDERMDLELIRELAARRPEWQLVLVGPVAKIDPASLPRAANIHYLGMKKYEQLPAYMAGWDVALLPFARNDATRYISPTKTPEYLAAGLPVVSTSVKDVVTPYGERGLVHIADTADEFARAIESAWSPARRDWRRDADALLATMSWDRTWSAMHALIEAWRSDRRSAPARAARPSAPADRASARRPAATPA